MRVLLRATCIRLGAGALPTHPNPASDLITRITVSCGGFALATGTFHIHSLLFVSGIYLLY